MKKLKHLPLEKLNVIDGELSKSNELWAEQNEGVLSRPNIKKFTINA